MKKTGFIIAPNSRVAGSLVLNRELFKVLNEKGMKIEAVMPDTDKFYRLPIVGSLLNYFTLYRFVNKYDYIIGTSFATLPFINSQVKIIQQFHSTDTGSYLRVTKTLSNQNETENKIMKKWLGVFKDLFNETTDDIISKIKISQSTEAICARQAVKILAVSSSVKEEIVRLFNINPIKIKVILNGINDFWFKENKKVGETRIFFTSRANSTQYTFLEKGLDRSFEILSKSHLPSTLIFHFGTSTRDFVGKFKNLVNHSLKKNDQFYFNLTREEIKNLYSSKNIFLQTSRTEACQLTLLEAMASKMVPVTFPIGIAPEIIKNGKNGYLVKSVEEAVEIINNLSRDEKKISELAENAFETAKKFTFEQMANQYKKEIGSIIK